MKPLPTSFFAQDSVLVAKELLGKIIEIDGMQGRIVETEAYGADPASHAFKRTKRSALMYDTFGHVYVYLIYGMYNCLNFTTEKNTPGAVLIRAVEPLSKIKVMKTRRNQEKNTNLCSGPGKLCQAFEINKEYNGHPIGKKIHVFDDGYVVNTILSSSRIGIKDAQELEWRFFVKNNLFVSKGK
jgi:DNA-3-methyladenine glycosylase